MTRLNVSCCSRCSPAALYLVRVAYESRRLFAELDQAQNEERKLDDDSERLKTELRAQATPLRVERTAREQLAMRAATPAMTQYVELPKDAGVGSVAGSRAVNGNAKKNAAKARAAASVKSFNYSTQPAARQHRRRRGARKLHRRAASGSASRVLLGRAA